MTISLLIIAACMLASVTQGNQSALELTHPAEFASTTGKKLNYRLYRPAAQPLNGKVPLVLFLHGAGERGDNNKSQLVHGVSDIITFAQINGEAFIVAPQCPAGEKWVNTDWTATSHTMPPEPSAALSLVMELLSKLTTTLPVDTDRIYVTGISMGGYGVWDILQRRPDIFAAALPICGGGDTAQASRLKEIPIWTVHGDQDGAVPVNRSRDMSAALEICGGKIQYTEHKGAGHNVWTRTYSDPLVLQWLFAQNKKAR